MSMFNIVVPPHPLSREIIAFTSWGYDKSYREGLEELREKGVTPQPWMELVGNFPLSGRIRYVWMNEDYTKIHLLLKNGPESWSNKQENEKVVEQAKSHPWFESVEVYQKDQAYLIVTFEIRDETVTNGPFLAALKEVESGSKLPDGYVSVSENPFDIFAARMEALNSGVDPFTKEQSDEINNLMDELMTKTKIKNNKG